MSAQIKLAAAICDRRNTSVDPYDSQSENIIGLHRQHNHIKTTRHKSIHKMRLQSTNKLAASMITLIAIVTIPLALVCITTAQAVTNNLISDPLAKTNIKKNLLTDSTQEIENADQHYLRHKAHYLNIVPSVHFQYNEGRQLNARSLETESDHRPVGAGINSHNNLQQVNDATPGHIYKRSSAALISPQEQQQQHRHNYNHIGTSSITARHAPLVSSSHPLQPGMAAQSLIHPHQHLRLLGDSLSRRSAAVVHQQQQPRAMDQQSTSHHPQVSSDSMTAAESSSVVIDTPPPVPKYQPQHQSSNQVDLLLRQKQHIQYHDQWPSTAGKCHKRTLNFCASVLPFNTTTFPNIIGDTNRFEVKRSLPFFGFLAKSSCNKRLDELLCLLLEPPCSIQSGQAIPPCKKFCRLALEGCNEYIPATLALSSVFDCRQYPESNDPSVCINLAQGSKCSSDEFKCPDKTCIPSEYRILMSVLAAYNTVSYVTRVH